MNRISTTQSAGKKLKRLFTRIAAACRGNPSLKDAVPVFGAGVAPCDLMIIGEAPGREETRDALPFVGKAGKFLIAALKEVFGKDRDEFYITNVVKVWPRIETKRLKTRKPLKAEEEFFVPYLEKEIEIVRPRVILAVGKTAFSALAPDKEFKPGVWCDYGGGILLMPVYHPSYLLRKQKKLLENTKELKAALREVKKMIS
ncbi:MAG: uracil-DNA glycosylase [Deltaproteobacteria bacterium]|nr:uracil-DNA glycosylase [Deltaproteobacteria bacterium]